MAILENEIFVETFCPSKLIQTDSRKYRGNCKGGQPGLFSHFQLFIVGHHVGEILLRLATVLFIIQQRALERSHLSYLTSVAVRSSTASHSIMKLSIKPENILYKLFFFSFFLFKSVRHSAKVEGLKAEFQPEFSSMHSFTVQHTTVLIFTLHLCIWICQLSRREGTAKYFSL